MFDFVQSMIETSGYAGLFFLMVLENVFPPIPSEVILPLAGFSAADGELNLVLVIAVASVGAVVGCLPWYFLGRYFNTERLKGLAEKYGRIMTVTPDDVDKADSWFHRYGYAAIFFGRLIPTVRTLISVPAGIARMPLSLFLVFSFFGTALWSTALVLTGYILKSEYEPVAEYISKFADLAIVVIVAIYLYRVVTFKK